MQNRIIVFLSSALACAIALSACNGQSSEQVNENDTSEAAKTVAPVALARTPSPEGAELFFLAPSDGSTVRSPFAVGFGIRGMTVVKAGENLPDSGHHHLLIDTDLPDLGGPIPLDAQHLHFGDGSTAVQISLEPGKHTLQMLLGDYLHIPHSPPVVSKPITITVE